MRFSSKPWLAHNGSNTEGLYYYGYRFYDPLTQRWLNRDPSGEDGGLNLYAFVNNNPITRIDHLGLDGSGGGDTEAGQGKGFWEWLRKTAGACKEWCKRGWGAGPEKIRTGPANSVAGAATRVIGTVAQGSEAGAGLTAIAAISKPCNACVLCLSEACDESECDAICAECERVKGRLNPNVLLK
jgi:RHS repeat-associated protein